MRERDFSNDETWPPRGIADLDEEGPDGKPRNDETDRQPRRPDEFVIRLPGRHDEL
jgi:hypothetical protein